MVEKLETSVNRGYVPKDLFLKRDLIPLVGMGTSMYRVFSNDFLSPNESFFDKKRKIIRSLLRLGESLSIITGNYLIGTIGAVTCEYLSRT